MRQQRTQRTSAPVSTPRASRGLPTSGYALVVDGQMKTEFDTIDSAQKAALDLKRRYPVLQVKVFDAEKKQSDTIEQAAA